MYHDFMCNSAPNIVFVNPQGCFLCPSLTAQLFCSYSCGQYHLSLSLSLDSHWPDFADKDDQAKLGAEAFAFVNFARFAVPLRIGLALGTTPWIQENIVDQFMKKEGEGEQCEVEIEVDQEEGDGTVATVTAAATESGTESGDASEVDETSNGDAIGDTGTGRLKGIRRRLGNVARRILRRPLEE